MSDLSKLVRTLATALSEFADSEFVEEVAERSGPASAAEELPVEGSPRPADEHRLGRRQLQIVELPGLVEDGGLKTADIAAAVDYEVPNTYTALQALTRSQVVEQVPGKEPQHWRLVRRYRAGSQAFARTVAVLESGEWTTAADVSIAVRGDIHAAPAIARAGLSPRVYADQSRAELESEGVGFLDDGRPDPRQQVAWHELRRRTHAYELANERRRKAMRTGTMNYLEIPAIDLAASATFYEQVFGWTVRWHPTPGQEMEQTTYPDFADPTGHNGGAFVLNRPPSPEPGLLPHIAVDSIDDTLAAVVAHGGEIVQPRTAIVEGVDWTATFRDPAGNTLALFEEADR